VPLSGVSVAMPREIDLAAATRHGRASVNGVPAALFRVGLPSREGSLGEESTQQTLAVAGPDTVALSMGPHHIDQWVDVAA
jgi:hypothetical protein